MTLDPDRLMSLDEHGERVAIIPAEVKGKWRRWRTYSQIVLLLIFLILPWTSFRGLQTIQLDVANRQFIVLGTTFFSHDAPLIFFFLLASTIGLAFVTSIWGRVWCGWACPQTVFIDGLYRNIEIFIEGNYLERRKMLTDPLTAKIFFKKTLKWVIFTIVSSIIAHSFIAYFSGAKPLLQMMQTNPSENWTYFVLVTAITAGILFDFGWFREQFCIIMCPYGRIQSVLMDQNSLAVVYDEKRGEPRRGKAAPGEKQGDCVACNRCVQVCPTACDIRKGVQMECIACTACIDACDEIMAKVNKPKGLIRYDSVSGKRGNLASPRSLIYMVVLLLAAVVFIVVVFNRKLADVAILRSSGTPYSMIKDQENQDKILNQFKVHIKNQTGEPLTFQFTIDEEDPQAKELKLIFPAALEPLQPSRDATIHFFIEANPKLTEHLGLHTTRIKVTTKMSQSGKEEVVSKQIHILGPGK